MMATRLCFHPHSLPLSTFHARSGALVTLPNSSHLGFLPKNPAPPFLLRGSVVARLGPDLPDLEGAGASAAGELFHRLEGLVYTVADAAVSASDAGAGVAQSSKQNGDWLSGITDLLETVLKVLKDGLSTLHVPYAYGFAIILLTVLVKAATFPLTKKQVESALAMRSMQPQIKAIQQRYAGDQEKIQLETARLYKLAGVNPLAGCLPTLVTIPVWIGLYRALSNVANEGLLVEGFFWIPSLAGPTTVAARQSGSGISWLFPFVDGHPPLGWSDTLSYLVLPVLLVISQYISAQIMQPQKDGDPSQNSAQAVTKILPLMIGYFALSVPSGLSLYWLTNNILSTAQQIWLQKLGGAKNAILEYMDKTNRDELQNTQKSVSSIQKSVVDVGIEEAKPSQGEQASPGGLRPGERFKQLKEQEARRRKQSQEERNRAQRVAEGSSMANEKQIHEVKPDASEVEQDALKDQKKVDSSSSSNGGLNSKARSLEQDTISLNNVPKEEATETQTFSGNQTSLSSHNRREPTTGTDEV